MKSSALATIADFKSVRRSNVNGLESVGFQRKQPDVDGWLFVRRVVLSCVHRVGLGDVGPGIRVVIVEHKPAPLARAWALHQDAHGNDDNDQRGAGDNA